MDSSDLLLSESVFIPYNENVGIDTGEEDLQTLNMDRFSQPQPMLTQEEAMRLLHLAASFLQAHIKRYFQQKRFRKLLSRHRAAVKIQAAWKGYKTRHLDVNILHVKCRFLVKQLNYQLTFNRHIENQFLLLKKSNEMLVSTLLSVVKNVDMLNYSVIKQKKSVDNSAQNLTRNDDSLEKEDSQIEKQNKISHEIVENKEDNHTTTHVLNSPPNVVKVEDIVNRNGDVDFVQQNETSYNIVDNKEENYTAINHGIGSQQNVANIDSGFDVVEASETQNTGNDEPENYSFDQKTPINSPAQNEVDNTIDSDPIKCDLQLQELESIDVISDDEIDLPPAFAAKLRVREIDVSPSKEPCVVDPDNIVICISDDDDD